MKPYKNISRVDYLEKRTHAWLVQVQRKNRIVMKMFSDNVFGGKEKALQAALQYRDAVIVAASPASHNHWRRTIVRKNNKSGVPGVYFDRRPNGSERWIAYWNDETGVKRSKCYALSIHGDKAKELAIAERSEQLKRIFAIISDAVQNK